MTSAFDAAWISRCLLLGFALLPLTGFAQSTIETPSNVLITGIITPSTTTPPVSPGTNDLVQAIGVSSGKIEGQGSVASSEGGFAIEMSKTSAFNGTQLLLRLARTDGNIFALTNPDGSQFRFPYNGGFFPVTASFSLKIGAVVSTPTTTPPDSTGTTGGTSTTTSGSTGGAANTTGIANTTTLTTTPTGSLPGCSSPSMDVNGDGRCDALDIELIKEYIAGRTRTIGRRDVNNDGVVNTRDVIDLIRSINQSRRPVAPDRREERKNEQQ